MTYAEFMRQFPSSDACLDYLRDRYFPAGTPCPKCEKPSRFHRIKGRSAYSCQYCGHHVYPTAGTIFHKTTTSLQLWFWAIYLISSSKCGISAKQLGREIGVSYKTAHRMLKQIRTLLSEDDDGPTLSGEVEVDETFLTGRLRAADRRRREKDGVSPYTPAYIDKPGKMVVAAVERHGRVRASVAPDRSKETLQGKVREFVLPAGTQNVESFFALFKNSVRGAHHSISAKYLPNYLDEYTFRWNRRKQDWTTFWDVLDQIGRKRLSVA